MNKRLAILFVLVCGALTVVPDSMGKPVSGAIVPEPSPAGNAFAAAHLALIFGVFAGFAIFAWILYRRSKAPNKEREFIEELHEEQQQREIDRENRKRSGAGGEKEESLEPWEKSGDWWKKE